MQKIYTNFKPSNKNKKSPKQEVLNNILNFSRSLEVVKSKKKNVEIVLN